MKKPWAALLIVCGLLRSQPALAQHQINLCGIVNVPGQQVAFLQIDNKPAVVKTGDHFKVWARGNYSQLEVLDVDLTNGIVTTRIESDEYTNSLPMPDRTVDAKSWIYLQHADFIEVMQILGLLTGRSILLHPDLLKAKFSCDASWTDAEPSKGDINTGFAKFLNRQDVALLEDGDCFLQVVPAAMAQTASLGAKDLPKDETEAVASGTVNFRNVDISEAIEIYAKLIGRVKNSGGTLTNYRGSGMYFTTTCPLSKAQVVYALETLFRWNGTKIVLNSNHTFNAVSVKQ